MVGNPCSMKYLRFYSGSPPQKKQGPNHRALLLTVLFQCPASYLSRPPIGKLILSILLIRTVYDGDRQRREKFVVSGVWGATSPSYKRFGERGAASQAAENSRMQARQWKSGGSAPPKTRTIEAGSSPRGFRHRLHGTIDGTNSSPLRLRAAELTTAPTWTSIN
jgi:hypothetical protein